MGGEERIVDILVRRDGARELTLNGVMEWARLQHPELHAELEEGRRNARLSLNRWREATGNEFSPRTDRNNRGDYKFLNYALPVTQPEAARFSNGAPVAQP